MIDSAPLTRQGTRRQRRILRMRQTIMDAAAEQFAQKGYRATTTKDIAQAVDLGESTLYGYFSSKQEVLQAILSQEAELVDSLLVHVSELQGRQSFVELVDLLMEKVLTRVVYNRVLIAEAWTDDRILQGFVLGRMQPIMALLKDFIASRSAAGTARPIDPGLGARMLVAFFIAALLPFLRGVEAPPSPEQRRQLAETFVDLVFNGFNAQKG